MLTLLQKLPLLGRTLKEPSITFVPLANDVLLTNPADKRRIGIPEKMSRGRNFRTNIATLSHAVTLQSDILYIQSRDFLTLSRCLANFTRAKLVFSFSDAFLCWGESGCHREFPEANAAATPPWISEETKKCFQRFDMVICGSTVQKQQICDWGLTVPERCVASLDPLDTDCYKFEKSKRTYSDHDPLRFVWEGFYDNIPALSEFATPLASLAAKRSIELVILCSPRRRTLYRGTDDNQILAKMLLPNVPLRFETWSPEVASREMSKAHIGLNPALRDRFNWSKPANKSVILNWFGLPVIASGNPANKEWIAEGQNGFTVNNKEEWERIVSKLSARRLYAMSHVSRDRAKIFQKEYEQSWLNSLNQLDDESTSKSLIRGFLSQVLSRVQYRSNSKDRRPFAG